MSNKAWIYAGLALGAGATAVGLVRVLTLPRVRPGKTRLFLVGDSLAVGLAPHLRALSHEASVPFEVLARQGTRIDQWAGSQVLRQKLESFRPTLVLVSLGTNDEYLGAQAPGRQAPALKKLLSVLSPYGETVWVGPPSLPIQTHAMSDLIRRTVGDTHYFRSESLDIPRGPDQLHPTARGYAAWAGALWRWLS